MSGDVEHFFVFIGHFTSSFENCLFSSFVIYSWIGRLFTGSLVFELLVNSG
jgi:hypothetical protein